MKKLKVYLDTSVIGYLVNNNTPEKTTDTFKLWEEIKKGKYDIFISEIFLTEVSESPNEIKEKLLNHLREIKYTLINIDNQIENVAEKFIELKILNPKSYDDCQHIACAIISNCDVIVSWNFKHIVNHKTIKGVKAIAALEGYNDILIYTPSILIGGDNSDT